ncbi:RNHCP domain-containing protein [Nocardiopsis sp. MG754419]|uniref:RNHCP domain-containing protein n=1 Tax=Nocardiopsis sp. MG754419 TaxID=2259865 RepID=UPI0027DC9AF0|nr:RNHCP domain-containing protein [Nocardiopsis sp. MG754419]
MSITEPNFTCLLCGLTVSPREPDGDERDHCPSCLTSRHVHDQHDGGATDCEGRMTPLSIVVSSDGRWRLVHRCARCDELSESGVTTDDNPLVLMRIAVRPLAAPPFPLDVLGRV